jgi:hypothetical protein
MPIPVWLHMGGQQHALLAKATAADAAARALVLRLQRHLETARPAGGPGEATTAGKPAERGGAGDRRR